VLAAHEREGDLRIELARHYGRLREIWLEKDQKLNDALSRITTCQMD
jgi:hypothetical protein